SICEKSNNHQPR
nr:immunoglobulin heavy chain junction region [Homo sapiens]